MDERSLLIEAQTTGPKGYYEVPLELKLYGTNDPAMRESLVQRMKADKLPVGHASDRKRKEAKEREKMAKEAAKRAKKQGAAVVGVGEDQATENSMAEFAAGSSQSLVPGRSMDDIIGGSERFNPRNVEQMVEEFGVKEADLVSQHLNLSNIH
jgi:SWI/SNF-related matrix-associated actin-dependent regulator of chromatin subfamily A3